MQTNYIKFSDKYIKNYQSSINKLQQFTNYINFNKLLIDDFDINSTIDQDIINSYTRDWSNIKGNAELLCRPNTQDQCAILLYICNHYNIPITISAGKTNLTGSATPFGGVVLSTEKMLTPNVHVDINNKKVISSVGILLEDMRNEVLNQSNGELHYPVDPTSRYDAFVGGTLSCNASGFVPGEKGATRYWVQNLEFVLTNGYIANIKRGQYKSKNGIFIFDCNGQKIEVPILRYNRPNIKNASGPYSSKNHEIDLIDFIVGSEGIFGMILSCTFKLADRPKDYLELFIRLQRESQAIDFHSYLYNYFNQDMSRITALEYFGFNCQNYMKNKQFLFNNSNEVGIYLQIPIFCSSLETKIEEWSNIISDFDKAISLDDIIVLNEPTKWKIFFDARHSIPDNALTKTRKIGGISIITDTIVPQENFKKYIKSIHSKLKTENIEYLLFGHLGDCHLHFHLIPSKNQHVKSLEVYDYMIDLSAKLGGVYSAEHGTGKRKKNDFAKCYGKSAIKMVHNTKKAVDPNFILNRSNVID